MTARRRPLLGELLVRHGLISPAELTTALEKQQGTTKRLGEILVEMGAMSEADLTRMLELQNKPPGDENASQSDPDPGGETEAGIWVAVKVHGIFQATSVAGPEEHRYQLPRGSGEGACGADRDRGTGGEKTAGEWAAGAARLDAQGGRQS